MKVSLSMLHLRTGSYWVPRAPQQTIWSLNAVHVPIARTHTGWPASRVLVDSDADDTWFVPIKSGTLLQPKRAQHAMNMIEVRIEEAIGIDVLGLRVQRP
jgi:hypothetical protein